MSQPFPAQHSDVPHLIREQVGKTAVSYPILPGEDGLTLYGNADPDLNKYPLSDFTHGRLYNGGYLSLTDSFCTRMYNEEGTLSPIPSPHSWKIDLKITVYRAVNAQIIVSYRRDRPLDCPLAPITEHL